MSEQIGQADFILVGQGIAGSCLAYELVSRGLKTFVFDEDWRDAACLVAAGVINPITGKRLVKSWRSELAHPFAREFYPKIQKKFGAEFYHDRKILQLCKSAEEAELWLARAEQPEYAPFIEKHSPGGTFAGLNDAFGSFEIGHSAWVESKPAMFAFKIFLQKEGILRNEKFEYGKLKISDGNVEYGNLNAKKIVFCEGWRVRENPYFNWLPWRPAKGEIIEAESASLLDGHVIHRGNWLMKCAENRFRTGSTWDRENLDTNPTSAARDELLGALKNILPNFSDAKLVLHTAGVRPCTATTRPHLGAHPVFKNVFCFNGFGSKGYALSPYFARHFADYLQNISPLDSEADLARHVKKFFKRA